MDDDEQQRLSQLIHACDEVLDAHNADTDSPATRKGPSGWWLAGQILAARSLGSRWSAARSGCCSASAGRQVLFASRLRQTHGAQSSGLRLLGG